MSDKNDISNLQSQLDTYGAPEQVLVSCVAGEEALERVKGLVESWSCSMHIAETQISQLGVTCGYSDYKKMGVDRWLAIIAAYSKFHQACVVVGAGTAITVDLVDASGVHHGGYIVPGFYKMRSSLFQGTNQVKVESLAVDETGVGLFAPGVSTAKAVSNGLFTMVKGLLEQAFSELKALGRAPRFIVYGGDASLIERFGIGCTVEENLVLDGLIALAEAGQVD